MGELQDAVSTLLQAFSHGLSIIKTQRSRRKKEKVQIDPSRKAAEADLSKTLRRSRSDVRKAYDKNQRVLGPGFAVGDEEAHFSLSSILLRLNAGFVAIIERFTRGKSTQTDYQALVNLSNASRIEAIRTFEQLSSRMSQSSLSLTNTSSAHKKHKKRKRSKNGSISTEGLKYHTRSKSAPETIKVTPLGSGTSDAWVRPKPGRKLSSDSKSSGSTAPKKTSARLQSPNRAAVEAVPLPKLLPAPDNSTQRRRAKDARFKTSPPPVLQPRNANRKSIMSFTSASTDSTKIGEIPEHKWARPGMFYAENPHFPITAYYPIEPFQEPVKQRSRFMRLFTRSGG